MLDIAQCLVQFSSRWILLLINGISNDLKKLDKYLIGTTIFAFFNTPLLSTAANPPKITN